MDLLCLILPSKDRKEVCEWLFEWRLDWVEWGLGVCSRRFGLLKWGQCL